MFGEGPNAPRKRRHARRYAFFALLLMTLVAPIGWVAASAPRLPYVVLFNDAAVTVPDTAVTPTTSSLAALLSRSAQAPQSPRPLSAVTGTSGGTAHRRVDPDRVARHIQDVAARDGINDIDDVYSSAVGGFAARLTAGQSAALAADPSVAAVYPDEEFTADDMAAGLGGSIRTTSNPIDRIQPGIRRIGARSPAATALTAGGRTIDADVAIIDTGIQRNHPDLNVVGGYNCTSRDRTKWDDNEGHGTHVAGVVGALDNHIGVTGVAPGVRLWSVKVLDSNGHGFVSWLVCGIDWVTAQRDDKANPSRPLIEVANMSLEFTLPGGNDRACGSTNNDTVHLAICRSVNKGTTYVVAAGNDSKNVRTIRPAAYDEVITVSAMADYDGRGGARGYPAESCPYWSGEPDDAFTSFSNYGADVDLIAPGKCILSTYLNGRYAWMSGTSMATPHVAGAAVIYKTLYPRATPDQVRMALVSAGTLDWRTNTDRDTTHEKAVYIGSFHSVPDFTIGASVSSAVVSPGSTLAIDVSLGRAGGFDDAVTVTLADPPAGITATPIVTKGSSATLTVRVASNMSLGRYTLTVIGQANDVQRLETLTLIVRGSAPQSAFTAPRGDLNVQRSTAVTVAWTESTGGASITARRLDRQIATIRTPGTCAGASYATDVSRNNATDLTDNVRSGFCYRWALTLTDSAGLRSTVYSGAVLVDATAPHAPLVRTSGEEAYTPDLGALGVGPTYLSPSGVLWVRASASGSAPFDVGANDPESGIARNVASITGSGLTTTWIGDSTSGSLRLNFSPQSATGTLSVSSVNGAGTAGPQTSVSVVRDGSAPAGATWVSAPASTTRDIRGSYFKLDWSASTDTGSGLASQTVVGRYVAPLNADGTCKTNGFVADGGFRLASDNSWDSGLRPSSCYVWSVRTVDHVGNMSASVVSGYVITDRT